ncbi:hypothetical protein C8R45DRAFT_1176831 [Mycena sanguinolenta]|nr:hypothetical protein C8R45DRAFT_1176831 [Mycena sanguinolenta]
MQVGGCVFDQFCALVCIFALKIMVYGDGEATACSNEVLTDVGDPSELTYEGRVGAAEAENVTDMSAGGDPKVAEDNGQNDREPVMADEHPACHRKAMLVAAGRNTSPGVVDDGLDQLRRDHRRISRKLLEAGTQRSLHAAGFSRCSGHASAVLTDLLARYIQLLASTAARYAEHAGRTTLTSTDALEALDDLGFGLQDLIDYIPEAKDLSRYAVYSARRVEELHEFKAHLGRNIRDDAFALTYAQYDGDDEEEEELDDEEDEDEAPPLKRQRTLDWEGHIPDFLPPFPLVEDAPESPRAESPQPLMPPPLPSAAGAAAAPLGPQLTATSTSAADYVLQVPYDASSLADVSQWHLPGPPPRPPPPTQTPSNSARPPNASGAPAPTLNPQLALYKAFYHILKNPTRDPAAPTPARHRVALGLLTHSALVPRWEVPDSMYASSAPSAPRAWPIVPTFAVPASSKHAPDADDTPQRRFPSTTRSVATPDRIAPLVASQGSRLPELSRRVLPPSVYTRVTKLSHPPALSRVKNGATFLKYGQGVPAPWNAPPSGAQGGDGDGKGKDGDGGRIPDARVYATWEYEAKDFRAPLNLRKVRGAAQSQAHAGTSAPTPSRRSSRVGG